MTNLETGREVWIGDGKGEKGLRPLLEALGRKVRRRIRSVVSDLRYRAVLADLLSGRLDTRPLLHRQWMNEGLNALRRRIFSAAPLTLSAPQLK